MNHHPKRYLVDGTATTTRVDSVELVGRYPDGEMHFQVLTSWAGDPIPRFRGITATYERNGAVVVWPSPRLERETPQFIDGIRRRVRNMARALVGDGGPADTERGKHELGED